MLNNIPEIEEACDEREVGDGGAACSMEAVRRCVTPTSCSSPYPPSSSVSETTACAILSLYIFSQYIIHHTFLSAIITLSLTTILALISLISESDLNSGTEMKKLTVILNKREHA